MSSEGTSQSSYLAWLPLTKLMGQRVVWVKGLQQALRTTFAPRAQLTNAYHSSQGTFERTASQVKLSSRRNSSAEISPQP